jgi:thiamine-monophosphate kinase
MMKLNSLGEDKIISWIGEFLGKPPGVLIGVGDDTAVVNLKKGKLAVCSDMIQEGSHIYKGMTPYQAGRKVAIVNFSDLAAMGAKPKGFLMSISISPEEEFSFFKDIFHGVEAACREAGAHFVGGDMNKGETLVLDGFAFGEVEKPMRRTGASPGDIVAVTGYLGSAACGWQVLQKGLSLDEFETSERDRIVGNIIKPCVEPRARVREGLSLAGSGAVTSCTDISDGLAFSLGYMRDGYGFEIYEEKIPIRKEFHAVCERFGLDKNLLAYHIGEDFELLCTIKPKRFAGLKKKLPCLREIGRVVDGNKIKLIKKEGGSEEIKPSGYNHFS